jgi:1L-myo-inositol 1-phosphate cytidylyltransferase / CDP-L-myo-inositol myo-inositolphosphotransferase
MAEQLDREGTQGDRAEQGEPDLGAAPVPASRTGAVPRVGVVLAAGRSERLHLVTGGGSKALVRLGGLSLVERAVLNLLSSGIERVVVVVGYHAGPVGAVVARIAPGRVRTVHAERWELGNGASLAAAASAVAGERLFALVTADHVFGQGVLRDLLQTGRPAVLVDRAPHPVVWAEGTRVREVDGAAHGFGKHLDEPGVDCGAFLLPASVFEHQRLAAARGDWSLAGAVAAQAQACPLAVVPVAPRGWWQDVDTPQDLDRARRLLRRSLGGPRDGPVSHALNRPISTRLSMALAPLRPSPDLVSWVAFVVALAAAWLLGGRHGLAGGVLAQVASVVDGVDGELARLQFRAGPWGAMLDGVLDRLGDAALLGGLAVWAGANGASAGVTLLAVAAVAGSLLSMSSKDRIAALALPPAPEHAIGYLLAGRDGRLLLVALAGIAGRPVAGLAAVAVTSFAALAVRLVAVRRTVRHGARGAPVRPQRDGQAPRR